MKYIDAVRLKAEIERHIKEVKEAENRFHPNLGFFDAKLSGIYDVMAIIDSLQQEHPSLPSNLDEAAGGKDSLQAHWKPSVKQLAALDGVIADTDCSRAYVLRELWNQLKKLQNNNL